MAIFSSTSNQPFEMNARQRALHDELLKIEGVGLMLADMYHGALTILQSNAPDCFAFAAHGIREIMEKFPGIEKPKETLKDKINPLLSRWNVMNEKAPFFCIGENKIDKHIELFFKECSGFFKWFREAYPTKREIFLRVLRKFTMYATPLSPELEKLNFKLWNEMNIFFQNVCHHTRFTNETEFQEKLSDFESFLLDWFHPQTYTDFDALDEIIQEGEQ